MRLTSWELSFGVFTGFLFGYRQYIEEELLKIDHVVYLGLFDCCITLLCRSTRKQNRPRNVCVFI